MIVQTVLLYSMNCTLTTKVKNFSFERLSCWSQSIGSFHIHIYVQIHKTVEAVQRRGMISIFVACTLHYSYFRISYWQRFWLQFMIFLIAFSFHIAFAYDCCYYYLKRFNSARVAVDWRNFAQIFNKIFEYFITGADRKNSAKSEKNCSNHFHLLEKKSISQFARLSYLRLNSQNSRNSTAARHWSFNFYSTHLTLQLLSYYRYFSECYFLYVP